MFTWRVHWFLSEIKARHWFISWYIFTDIISDYFTDSGLESDVWPTTLIDLCRRCEESIEFGPKTAIQNTQDIIRTTNFFSKTQFWSITLILHSGSQIETISN